MLQSDIVLNNTQLSIKTETSKGNINPKYIITILMILNVSLIGILLYLFLSGKVVLKDNKIFQSILKEEEVEQYKNDTQENDNLLTYTYDNPKMLNGFTMKYPNDWEVTKDDTTCVIDPLTNEEVCTNFTLNISNIKNPEYIFSLNMCSECSPGFLCIYPDSTYDQDSMVSAEMMGNYEEFSNGDFRRAIRISDENENKLTICKKENSSVETKVYISSILSSFNTVTYQFSSIQDEKLIEEMDDMVLSIKEVSN